MPRQLSRGDEALTGRQPVWDLPVRLVHWLLAGLIGFSWWSVKNHHIDWHIWSGVAILTLLIFRFLWGFVGSSTARWTGFVRGPGAVIAYLRGRWGGTGHTPLGALSVLAMFGAVAVQVGLGLFNEDEDGLYAGPLAGLVRVDTSDTIRGIHEFWFEYVLVALIALHLAAILFYRLRGRGLTWPMISGRGPASEPMKPGKWWAALLCLAIAVGIARWVVAGAPFGFGR
ncbi:MAG TPA: cytochrome b/b6 domain-containing protein [Sphingomicrobium sp.]